MKKSIHLLLAAAACLSALSCNKQVPSVPASPGMDGAVRVHIGMDETDTKTAFTENDFKDYQINNVQVFVFDSEGKLETDYYTTVNANKNTTVTFASFTGAKTVYAVLNHTRENLAKDYALSSFQENLLSDLSENSAAGLVMTGMNTITVTAYNRTGGSGSAPQDLTIYAKRLASLVLVEKVTVDFTNTSLADATFQVKELYLKNVVGKSRLGLNGKTDAAQSASLPLALSNDQHNAVGNWYNQGTKQNNAPAVTYDNCNINCEKVSGQTEGNPMNRCLLAYPNQTDGDSHASSFDARHTRLVMKANVKKNGITANEGVDTYYVFDLPVLVANHIYKVANITITMLGKDNDNQDDDLQQGRINPIITVDEWNTSTISYEF